MYAQIVSRKVKTWDTHRTVNSAETISDVSSAPSDATDLSERNMILLFIQFANSSDSATIKVIGYPESSGNGITLYEGTLTADNPSGSNYISNVAKIDTYCCAKFKVYVTNASSFPVTIHYGEV